MAKYIKNYTNENLSYINQYDSFTYNSNNFKWTLDFNSRVQSFRVQHRIRYYNGKYREDIGNNYYFETFEKAQEKFNQLMEELQCQ